MESWCVTHTKYTHRQQGRIRMIYNIIEDISRPDFEANFIQKTLQMYKLFEL